VEIDEEDGIVSDDDEESGAEVSRVDVRDEEEDEAEEEEEEEEEEELKEIALEIV
jgi:hypothetical protein